MDKIQRALQYFLFLIVISSLSSCTPTRCDDVSGDECLRILFVGNSYTFTNDLPNTFANLARSSGHPVEVAMLAEGGVGFVEHLSSPQFSSTLTSSAWDYVVLQEQSQIPSIKASRTQSMYPAARELVRQIRSISAEPIFFETWAHRGGFPENGLFTYEGMQYEINQGYARIASELNVRLAPVGLAWFRALQANPDLQLWLEDGSHPAEQGTYLAACVFYVTFFKESPVGLSYRGNLSEEVALQLQEAANSVLIDP
ncbi:MAG: hypothetical protein J0M11_22755 [Anaerolineae bacterium]|nr:hypothetical protein [Anaerolineae bacterium]